MKRTLAEEGAYQDGYKAGEADFIRAPGYVPLEGPPYPIGHSLRFHWRDGFVGGRIAAREAAAYRARRAELKGE